MRISGKRESGTVEWTVLSTVETTRIRVSRATDAKRKSRLGQFLTPASISQFMAGLFTKARSGTSKLLDAGAGIGSLSGAFLERCAAGELRFEGVEVTAFELDEVLHEELENTLTGYASRFPLLFKIESGDFIEKAVFQITLGRKAGFTHAILNPPYKKMDSNSVHRFLLRKVGIESVNLYTAFVALSLEMMAPGGELVAIIPRSFCNGPYYRPFREFVLQRAAIRHIHLFDSRDSAFSDDDVLQENIIIKLERGGRQGDVTITTSTDNTFADLAEHKQPFNRIVFPDDADGFIHVPTSADASTLDLSPTVRYSLEEIGVQVSTGPVVDFRMLEHLRSMPGAGTVPLLYPVHFEALNITWPRTDQKKPNAIARNRETEKWLFKNGFYCAVRRFSSKEEKRRITTAVIDPNLFPGVEMLGLENHLNIFHENKSGLPEEIARGLAVFLSSTVVDEWFRRFSGHTQVNATDLKLMKYPSRNVLGRLGKKAKKMMSDQQEIDDLVLRMVGV